MMVKKGMTELNFDLDEETARMIGRMVVLRVTTKHINLWARQLEMKRREICELAGLMMLDEVKKEIHNELSLQKWARRTSGYFTKKVKRMLLEEIDNVVWSGDEKEISQWCKVNKVFDEITDKDTEEIWMGETQDGSETVLLNGKYVWEKAKLVCDFIDANDVTIQITTFDKYRIVMKLMKVIREAHNVERKRRQSEQNSFLETRTRTQREKALINEIKRGRMRKEENGRKVIRYLAREGDKRLQML